MTKKKKLMVATNIYKIDPIPYASHLSMIYRLGKNLPELDLVFSGPWRMPIDVARNAAVDYALKMECDYLFFYDDDMVLHPDIIERLFARKKDIVMALCYIRGYPFRPMMFRFDGVGNLDLYDYKDEDVEDGLVKVDAVGNACTFINCEAFKLIPEPWFVTGKTHTEDVYFCMKARDYIEKLELYVDVSFESGHMLDKPILTSTSRKLLLKMYEKGINQLWQPDASYIKEVEYKNPLEDYKEKQNGNGLSDNNKKDASST